MLKQSGKVAVDCCFAIIVAHQDGDFMYIYTMW